MSTILDTATTTATRNDRILVIGYDQAVAALIKGLSDQAAAARIDVLAQDAPEDLRELETVNETVKIVPSGYESRTIDRYALIIVSAGEPEAARIFKEASLAGKLVFSPERPAFSNISLPLPPAAEPDRIRPEQKWRRLANWSLFGLACMFIGHALFSYIGLNPLLYGLADVWNRTEPAFLWMLAAGFFAQLVDGALGMGYGVISTSVLLTAGVNPAAISGSIHTAEMFSSGASGYSHYKFGNVNKKLFRHMLIPGVIGAILGAVLLSLLGEAQAWFIRPLLSVYTLFLGIRILVNAFRKLSKPKKVKNVGLLAWAGGFLDSFGGGGWGPLVTSTLISKGRSPKYVIGSVSVTEFFVTLASAVTFFIMLGLSHIQAIAGLIIGGLIAAPLAARLVGRLPVKKVFIGVGVIVILSSIRTLWSVVSKL
ncbi:sulfite exporter TauE/SafE family protein [Pedobacter sp. SYP-B3415]|uniref:sulfite exporter TauE/SafE family protein n=1 Tax=Pedobacter sp. SYP-B3415 TaxID=2496641 RepID=UPI001F0E75C2|nr:TSUP family transporter [Pedobacter sp. SYP-B3415]